jgi:hypothetical protein
MNPTKIESNRLSRELEVEAQKISDRDLVAVVINDLVERVILNHDQTGQKNLRKMRDKNIKSADFNVLTFEQHTVRCQEFLKQAHDRNIKTNEILGMPLVRSSTEKLLKNSNQLTFEERTVLRRKVLKQVHDRNIRTDELLDKMSCQNYSVNDISSQTTDSYSKINKKMVQGALLGGLCAGGIAAIIFAFILGPIWILAISIAVSVIGAIVGSFVSNKIK